MNEQNENNLDVNQTQIASGIDVVKKKKPVAIFALGGGLLLVIAAIISYLFIPSLKNTVNMMVMKPEKYYASVENNNVSKQAKQVGEQYSKIIEAYNNEKGTAVNYEISAEINPDFLEEYAIPEQFANIKLNGSAAMKDDKISSDMMLTVNDVKIITLKMLMDYVGAEAYLQIPELSDAFLKVPFDDVAGDIIDEMDSTGLMGMSYTPTMVNTRGASITEGYEKVFSGDLISDKQLEDLINKYYNIAIENIENVELEKGVEIEVGDIDAKFNTLTAKITLKDAAKIVEAILKEMKKDDVIINAITELGICTKSEYKDFIDEILEDIKSDPGSKSDYVKLITYVDSKGIICGRELEVYEDRDKVEDFELYYVAARDGDNIALDVLFQVDDDSFSIELNGKEKSKDTYSGNIKLEVESSDYWSDNIETYSFNIKFDGFNIANEEKGYINGKFSVDLIVTKFEVEFKSDGKSQEISFEIPDYATIKITYSESNPDDIKMPSSKDKIYDVENEDDMLKLMEEVDFDAFIEKLSEDLDFDLSLIGDLLYGYGDYNDYDDYYDDYDYDDYDDDDYEYLDIDYNFDELEITINGDKVVLSEGIADIASLVNVKGLTVIEAGGVEYLYNKDYTLNIDLENNTDEDLPIEKCPVDYINLDADSAVVDLKVNGITIGSTIKDISAAFNEEVDSGFYAIYINDTDDYFKYITLYIEEDIVTNIIIRD